MGHVKNSARAQGGLDHTESVDIPDDAVRSYIADMLHSLSAIAGAANLSEVQSVLHMAKATIENG